MRDKQVATCLRNLPCVTIGGFVSTPHPISRASLSDVLDPTYVVPKKYFLSPKAAAGILRRAAKRGKALPTALQQALENLATGT